MSYIIWSCVVDHSKMYIFEMDFTNGRNRNKSLWREQFKKSLFSCRSWGFFILERTLRWWNMKYHLLMRQPFSLSLAQLESLIHLQANVLFIIVVILNSFLSFFVNKYRRILFPSQLYSDIILIRLMILNFGYWY